MPNRPDAGAMNAVAELLMLASQYSEYGVSIVITPDAEGWCVGFLEDDDRRPGKRRGEDLSAAMTSKRQRKQRCDLSGTYSGSRQPDARPGSSGG